MQEFKFENLGAMHYPEWGVEKPGWLSGKLNIHDDVTIIIGPNGSGKTTLMQEIDVQFDGNFIDQTNSSSISCVEIPKKYKKKLDSLRKEILNELDPKLLKISNLDEWWRLSTGEHALLNMLGNLFYSTEIGQIALIDLPETYLHIEWQEKLVDYFLKYHEITGNRVVIATHSPFIINGHFDLIEDSWDNPEENKS